MLRDFRILELHWGIILFQYETAIALKVSLPLILHISSKICLLRNIKRKELSHKKIMIKHSFGMHKKRILTFIEHFVRLSESAV